MAEPIRSEQVEHLQMVIRYYAAMARRWENRAIASELELDAARERLAALGATNYNALEDFRWGAD